MQSYTTTPRFFLLYILAFILVMAMALMLSQSHVASTYASQDQARAKKTQKDKNLPLVIYADSGNVDIKERGARQARSSRYDKGRPKSFHVVEPVGEIEELPLNAHFWWGLSALPTTQSDAVLLGKITSAKAYLSNDKTGIYSEFILHIEEVLKNYDHALLDPGDSIAVEREGGAVKFPSGRIQYYKFHKQSMPNVGGRYVLFLKHNEQGEDFFHTDRLQAPQGSRFPVR